MIISGLKLSGGSTGTGDQLAIGDVILSPKETVEKDGKRYRLLPADGGYKFYYYDYEELALTLGWGKSIARTRPKGINSSWGSSLTYSDRELFTVQRADDGKGTALYVSKDLSGVWAVRNPLISGLPDFASVTLANNGKSSAAAVLYLSVNNEFGETVQVLKSVDKGVTFTPLWTNTTNRKIFPGSFMAANDVIAFTSVNWGESEHYLVYSVDKGVTWNEKKLHDGASFFWKIAFCHNSNTIYVANIYKCISVKVLTGVTTVTDITIPDLWTVYSISVDEYDKMLMLGTEAGIVFSNDGGATFDLVPGTECLNNIISDGFQKFWGTSAIEEGFFSYEPDYTSGQLVLKKEMLSELPEYGFSMTWAGADAIVYWTSGDFATIKALSGLSEGKMNIPDVGFGSLGKIVASVL